MLNRKCNAAFLVDLGIEADTEVCANCEHFCRHYNYHGILFYEGHCVYPRIKNRKMTDTCDYFEKRKKELRL